jgi:hypothetical protein
VRPWPQTKVRARTSKSYTVLPLGFEIYLAVVQTKVCARTSKSHTVLPLGFDIYLAVVEGPSLVAPSDL